ncbi:hypothetical protein V6N12_047077 [Hibiscus sabdariffa]|uniref:Uncharacterized protein n=1 Tax=Hibiscus sabdariffa TaxID=183260 RepID=A0ABR2AQB2_9ROSI
MSASKLVLQELYFLDSTLWHYHFRLIFVSFFVLIVFGKNKQIDVWRLRTAFLFLEWIGMNSMLNLQHSSMAGTIKFDLETLSGLLSFKPADPP